MILAAVYVVKDPREGCARTGARSGDLPGLLINAVRAVDLYHSAVERLENTQGLSAVIKPRKGAPHSSLISLRAANE